VPAPDALFFDVDGVLIDSLLVKGEALADTFNDFPGSRQMVIGYHLNNGGVNRSTKIAAVYRLVAGTDPSQSELDSRIARFGNAVKDRVIAADEIAGAEAALCRWASQCPLYAVSATPHVELQEILHSRGIGQYFRGIHGWPPTKDEAIADLLHRHQHAPEYCALIGDSQEDLVASHRTGIKFVQVSAPAVKTFPGNHPNISDLNALDSAIFLALDHQSV